MAWLLPRSWPGTHLFTGLWLQPPVAQGFDLTKSQSSGGRDKTIKAAMLQGALDSLQLPCSSSSACGEGQSPTGVTSDPLTLHIKASSCLPGTASLVWWLKPLQQRILGRALVPWGDREAHRTRRRRSIGSSSSSKRDRGLGACSPRHPDVPLSPGLPTGWADSDPVREKTWNLLGLLSSLRPGLLILFSGSRVSQSSHCLPMTALILPKPHFQTFLVSSPQIQIRLGRPCPLGAPFSMPSFKKRCGRSCRRGVWEKRLELDT